MDQPPQRLDGRLWGGFRRTGDIYSLRKGAFLGKTVYAVAWAPLLASLPIHRCVRVPFGEMHSPPKLRGVCRMRYEGLRMGPMNRDGCWQGSFGRGRNAIPSGFVPGKNKGGMTSPCGMFHEEPDRLDDTITSQCPSAAPNEGNQTVVPGLSCIVSFTKRRATRRRRPHMAAIMGGRK